MLQKSIMIDGRAVEFRSTAATLRLYRAYFGRDMIADMTKVQKAVAAEAKRKKTEQDNSSLLTPEILSMFEDIAFIMAKHADDQTGSHNVPETADEWLDSFGIFSVWTIYPELMCLWNDNNQQLGVPAKK